MRKTADENGYMPRIIDSEIDACLQVSGAVCIEGPKWCGKTWTSSHHASSEYFVGSPDNNFSNRQLAELNPVMALQGKTPRMIDEWQEVPALWDAVRAEIDRRGKKGQIILTGSSTPRKKGIMHSGIGRILSLKMNTMSLWESGDSDGTVSLKDICSGKFEPQMVNETDLNKLAYLIIRGGFPANIRVPANHAYIMPRAYMTGVINEDLNKLDDSIEYNRQKVRLLLKSLARNESTTTADSTLLKDIVANDDMTMSRNTVSKYLTAFERLFLINNQEPFSPNARSGLRVKQAEKRHFADPSMAAAMLNMTESKLIGDLNTFGFLFEALVERDLNIYARSFGGKLFHYQDYKNNEIDAVIEIDNGEWCAFEIKLGAQMIDRGAENLIKVCGNIENNKGKPPLEKCVICGLSNAAYRRRDGVIVVPITSLKN